MQPQQVDNITSQSQVGSSFQPPTPNPTDATSHHDETSTQGYGPPTSLQESTRSTSPITPPGENRSQQSFLLQTDKGNLFYTNLRK